MQYGFKGSPIPLKGRGRSPVCNGSFLLEKKFINGVMYIKSMHEFVEKYGMVESVEEESLMRSFQRWRKKMK